MQRLSETKKIIRHFVFSTIKQIKDGEQLVSLFDVCVELVNSEFMPTELSDTSWSNQKATLTQLG